MTTIEKWNAYAAKKSKMDAAIERARIDEITKKLKDKYGFGWMYFGGHWSSDGPPEPYRRKFAMEGAVPQMPPKYHAVQRGDDILVYWTRWGEPIRSMTGDTVHTQEWVSEWIQEKPNPIPLGYANRLLPRVAWIVLVQAPAAAGQHGLIDAGWEIAETTKRIVRLIREGIVSEEAIAQARLCEPRALRWVRAGLDRIRPWMRERS